MPLRSQHCLDSETNLRLLARVLTVALGLTFATSTWAAAALLPARLEQSKLSVRSPLCRQALVSSSANALPLSEAQHRFLGEWARLEEMKEKKNKLLKKQTRRVLREAQTVLAEKGVSAEIDPENPLVLLISPAPSGPSFLKAAALNKLASSLQNNLVIKIDGLPVGKWLQVEINPLMLKKDSAGALFDENAARLTLAKDNILNGSIDDMVIHEVRHAYNFYRQANGLDHDFTAWISYAESLPPIHETYPHTFSADELAAYIKQIALQIRLGKTESVYYRYAMDYSQTALILAQAMNRPQVMSLSLSALQSLSSRPADWNAGRWIRMKIEDKDQAVFLFNQANSQTRIYFYETPLLEEQPEVPLKITHCVVENGDYKIDLNLLLPLQEQTLPLALERALHKIQGLAQRGQRIEQALTKVIQHLSSSQFPQALLDVEEGLGAIQLEPLPERIQ